MREIGGYIELDRQSGTMYHDEAVALNCGRNALEYIIRTKNIKKIYLPYFCCDSIIQPCKRCNIEFEYYNIDKFFRPLFNGVLGENEWLYIVNYYGQLDNLEIEMYKKQYGRIIADYAQAFFQKPLQDVETIYTCRKFFGVSDGAFLYTDKYIDYLEKDESFEKVRFILGRYERTGSEFYPDSVINNERFETEPLKRMSMLTENMLRALNYEEIKNKRTANYKCLYNLLDDKNKLSLIVPDGAFMYPFYCKNGENIRKLLQKKKIYVPTLWPDVFNICDLNSLEYDYALNILPLPVDQRYNEEDMYYIADVLNTLTI